eukprot:2796786-Prymnesium_polylepis.1
MCAVLGVGYVPAGVYAIQAGNERPVFGREHAILGVGPRCMPCSGGCTSCLHGGCRSSHCIRALGEEHQDGC